MEEELTELEERKKELRSVLEALVDEAREILSKQEEIRVGVVIIIRKYGGCGYYH